MGRCVPNNVNCSMAKASKPKKTRQKKNDPPLAVKGTFLELMQAAVKDADSKSAVKKGEKAPIELLAGIYLVMLILGFAAESYIEERHSGKKTKEDRLLSGLGTPFPSLGKFFFRTFIRPV